MRRQEELSTTTVAAHRESEKERGSNEEVLLTCEQDGWAEEEDEWVDVPGGALGQADDEEANDGAAGNTVEQFEAPVIQLDDEEEDFEEDVELF